MKARLNKQEVEMLIKMQERIDALKSKLEDNGNDFAMQIEENGTICDNLDSVIASLEQILQEY